MTLSLQVIPWHVCMQKRSLCLMHNDSCESAQSRDPQPGRGEKREGEGKGRPGGEGQLSTDAA
eukprot:11591390-Alexandrium_andersonii.AAC.1